MRLIAPLIAAALLVAPAAEARSRHEAQRLPVVVELFTAQGCSDCPAANDLVARLSDQKGVITLTFSVDYWDYLGWKDTFAKPEFTDRQRAYKAAFRLRDVYTPQIVIDGASQFAGAKPDAVEAAVTQARQDRPYQPEIVQREDGRIAIGSGRAPRGGAIIWLVRYDPGVREVKITRGENKGLVVREADEVRQLVRLGPWRGRPKLLRLPDPTEPDLASVVLVQEGHGGPIIAAKALGVEKPNKPGT